MIFTEASGIVRKSTRIFLTQGDIMALLGCKKSKAYDIVRKLNELAKKNGNFPFPAGKANKYLFSDIFNIPIEEIDRVMEEEKEVMT